MSCSLGIVFKIASYIVDFAMGFFANVAWDKCKQKRRKKNTAPYISIQQSGATSTIDIHLESKNANAIDSAADLFRTYSNDKPTIPY